MFLALTVLFLVCGPFREVDGQSECSEAGITLCNSTNQLCQSETSSSGEQIENCYACLEGYVEFEGTNASTGCLDVSSLDLESFIERFKAQIDTEDPLLSSEQRLALLKAVASNISQHNAQQPPPSFFLELNKYSADSDDEALQIRGYRQTNDPAVLANLTLYESSDDTVPDAVDWVERGAVTSVKDQARCGCCWAVSAAGAIEGTAAITSNFTYLQSISFQQLISCNDGYNQGCEGGLPGIALLYSTFNRYGGMSILNDYSFSDEKGETTTECQMTEELAKVDTEGSVLVVSSANPETFDTRIDRMKRAVSKAPVSVAMKSNCRELSSYKKGVLTSDGDCACGPDMDYCLDHAILLVGFDDTHSPPYWKLKNSWSADWGEDGYFRIAQTNPSGNFSWGLFGILAEGVMIEQAFNRTGATFDEPQDTDFLSTWAIILIAAVAGLVVAALCSFAARRFSKRNED